MSGSPSIEQQNIKNHDNSKELVFRQLWNFHEFGNKQAVLGNVNTCPLSDVNLYFSCSQNVGGGVLNDCGHDVC